MLRVKKMREFDGCRSNSPEKQRERSKRYTPSFKLFAKNCWPKVTIYRDNSIYKKTKDSSRTSSSPFHEESSNKLQVKEEKVICEHLCCNENSGNFAKEQGVCLISSSSETQTSFEVYETLAKVKGNLTNYDEPIEESGFDYSTEEGIIFEADNQERHILIDLTADEKNTWKQTILKRFCDASTANETENEKHSTNIALESRIMIADNTTKFHCNGNGSLATALRDRGPCVIPVQPNRSLPIRPAPSVPTRFIRKDCSSLLVLPKSTTTSDAVEVDQIKLIDTPPNEKLRKGTDVNFEEEQMASRKFMSSLDCVFPQISSVRSLTGVKRKGDSDGEYESSNNNSNIKENRKKKKSQEVDSNENKEEHVESSIKEFLTNFCGSNVTAGIQNLCTNKCGRVVFTTKEENDKLVPPLRLKKIGRTETKGYSNSEITTGIEYESNYRIITGATPRPTSSPSLINWNDTSCEKNADFEFANTDSYKLKYRRNRLKQKLRELRSKALELAKQMANNTNSQQSTKLRQVMNRYEKQIENLSKLHSKLSAALPISNEVFDVNSDNANPPDSEHPFVNLNETSSASMNNRSPVSSLEPPKLSPRSPLNYDNILPEEIRNSPPILPRVCLTISPNEDLADEELQIRERNVWSVNEESTNLAYPADSPRNNYVDNVSSDSERLSRTTSVGQQNISFDTENSNLSINKGSLNHSKKIVQFPETNHAIQEKKNEKDSLPEEFPENCLMIQESNKFNCHGFSNPGPVISSVTSGLEVPAVLEEDEMFKITSDKQLDSSREHILHPNSYESNQHDVSASKVDKDSQNTQKVTSSSGQSTQFDTIGTTLSQENLTLQQDYKKEGMTNDAVQRSGSNHSITEQFPTLGNWLARMSKKQAVKTKSKIQTVGNLPCASTDNSVRIPGPEIPKMVGPNITNNIMNTTPQCNTEIWQYHHHQQQRQQLLQHVAASVTLSQPGATAPPLRSGICTSMPISQFYPNNYAIDPYSSALSYHPPICPYGTYPYHSRLHSTSLPGYFPVQDNLRSMQHMDKRFSPVQDPMVRYSSPSTNTLQHPSNLEFDRLQGSSVINNVDTTTCLSSLFSSPPSLSSSHQTLSRVPLVGYSTNNQFSRNRMIPDVVAAAAAAAVAAAASLDRKRDTLTYNRADTHTLSSTNITNVIDEESPHVPGSNKSAINRDVTHQTQDSNFNEKDHEHAKYQHMQNFLFDRLALVKTAENFAQTNSVIGNDAQTTMTPTVSTTQYQVPLIPPYVQLSKNLLRNESRNCETPHLGKVNRSPNSSHNFTCSNCGIIGPKFKCLGCEMAFYCNEQCQEKHWYIHVQRCPKKMPKLKKVT